MEKEPKPQEKIEEDKVSETKKPKPKVPVDEQDEIMAAGKKPDEITAEDVPDLGAVFTCCFRFWNKQPPETLKQAGYKSSLEVSESPWEFWLKVKDVFEPKLPKVPDPQAPGVAPQSPDDGFDKLGDDIF